MSNALLATKLYMPPVRRGTVMRPRLLHRLNEGLTRKLTLVSAPAGSGKTTLLSEWIRHDSIPAAWLSLDDNDNELARFLTYVIAALQTIEPSLGEEALATLQFPQLPPLDTILTPVINEIAALQDHIVLVLDDYHLIDARAVHEALIFLLDHLPPLLHLAIATRTDPPLPLARLRTRALMIEIRGDALRFNQEETDAFLNEMEGFLLSAEEVAALEARTEGWIAGLQLAALSMQGRDDVGFFIEAFTGTHRYILDYLTEEVLIRQSEDVQNFLLQTSILDRLTGSLCDAVTGQSHGQSTLEELEQANLFIVPLDDERNWYRYHHLFGDMLLRHLRKLHPEQVPTLHCRASAWYEEHDHIAEAIDHCLAAEDWGRAARLVSQTMGEMMARGEFFTTMLARVEALPDEIIRANPFLGVSYAWVLSITLQIDAADHRLQEIERIAGDELPDGIRLQMTVVRAALARQRHDVAGAFELLRQVEETLPDNPVEDDPLQRTARIGVAFNYADAYRFLQGHMALAQAHYTEALTLAQQAVRH
jgi:LuxR family maltose regulon positive regulatory protein